MAPGRILAVVLAGAAILLLCALWLALREPWLEVDFSDTGDDAAGMLVGDVGPALRAAGLCSGDRILEVRAGQASFRIPADWMIETPSYFIRYEQYNAFLRGQAALHALIARVPLELVRDDGTAFSVQARPRPLSSLPAPFWFQLAYALLALSVGTTLLAFRAGDPAARWFALASLGFFVGTLMRAVYGSRSLVLDADVFRAIVATAHAGALLATTALVCFVWHFPRRLGTQPVPALVACFAALAWVADTLQLPETTNLGYRGPLLLMFVPVVIFAILQWRAARADPLQRAMVRWLILVLLAGPASVGAGMLIVATGGELPIPRGTQGLSTVVLMYVGMVVLILRHRAFDLERWWFEAWVWFLGGTLAIGFDLLLIHALAVQSDVALAISLALCGWVYFPLRQYLLGRLWRRPGRDLREQFPELVRILLAPPERSPAADERWEALLARVFEPRTRARIAGTIEAVQIAQSGLRLIVPQAGGDGSIALDYANGGARLFSRHDVRLAQGMLDLLRQGTSLQEAYGRGAEHEQVRIARDLHDDIGARLLTLMHEGGSERVAGLARAALGDMRDIVAGLRARPLALADALADWRAELAQRAGAAGCRIEWRQPEPVPQALLSPRQQINLARILREAASNALRHAQPTCLAFAASVAGNALRLELRHDGRVGPAGEWHEGSGMANMRRRTADLAGTIGWHAAEGGLRVAIEVPVHDKAQA